MSDIVTVKRIQFETYDTKTFLFEWDVQVRPGQFIMVWVPGVDEVPMSVSGLWGLTKSITVKAIGDATKKLHELKEGDKLSIRGPFGNGFTINSNNALVVGGGVGAAAVMPVTVATGADTIIAARSENDLIMLNTASRYSRYLSVATDDGSAGFHGNAVQLMQKRLEVKRYDCVYACGPEVMLYYLHKVCEEMGQPCQLSLERHMKCGAGVCGSCMMDDKRICKEGPVFTGEQISQFTEFGVSKRDESGKIITFR